MDPKEERRLLQLYDEIQTDPEDEVDTEPEDDAETESGDENYQRGIDSSNDEDPYAGSDDRDLDYSPTNDSCFADSSDDSNLNLTPPPVVNQTVADAEDSSSDKSDDWEETYDDIPDFQFDHTATGVQLHFDHEPVPLEVFKSLWTEEVMDLLVTSTNGYGQKLKISNRPKAKHSRTTNFVQTTKEELFKFIGISLLQGQIRFPILRKLFSYDPLYYHPVFSYVMSGRRYEQLLRCFNCTNEKDNTNRLNKVSELLKILLGNYQNAYASEEALSLDESLLLHRGRLSFRQYIKGKKAKYGIKFYELCSTKGYTYNIDIYKGKQEEEANMTKLQSLVFRLLSPFLDKGHHAIMDNYYNSVPLSNKLLQRKTHTTGTLRSNRRENPKNITTKKLKKGEHKWLRKGKVYVSKWKDKREVLMITTKFHPEMIETANSYNQTKSKPKEVSEYNLNMAGIDRSDQLTSYYSCPRKSIRWYKKVMFHLVDITVVNSFLLYREITKSKISLLQFREAIIKDLFGISPDIKDGRKLVKHGSINNPRGCGKLGREHMTALQHILEKIPLPSGYNRKSYFLRCRQCSKSGKRGQTSWRCSRCEEKPPLCVGNCFANFHS